MDEPINEMKSTYSSDHEFYFKNIEKGALRIPLVAQNSSVLLLPKVAASLKLHDSTAR